MKGQDGQNASLSRFSKIAAVRHLGFVMGMFLPCTEAIWRSLRLCRFGWNRRSSFDNMYMFRSQQFGCKTPIHASKLGVFGGIDPCKWGSISTKPRKAHPWAERLIDRQNPSTSATCAPDEEIKRKQRQRRKLNSGKLGIRPDHPRGACVR